MPTPQRRTKGPVLVDTASPLVAPLPTHLAWDVLLLRVQTSSSSGTTPTHTTPAGWTLLRSEATASGSRRSRTSVYWKRAASGAEADPSVAWATPDPNHQTQVQAFSYSGCKRTGDPFEGANGGASPGTSDLAMSLTTTVDNCLAVAAVHISDNTGTKISGASFNQVAFTDSVVGADGLGWWGEKDAGAAGSGKGGTFTVAGGGVLDGITGVIFALLPDPTAELEVEAGLLGFSASSSGTGVHQGQVDVALPAFAPEASGSPVAAAGVQATAPAFSATLQGTQAAQGSVSATMPVPLMIQSAVGTPVITGSVSAVVPAFESDVAAEAVVTGSASATLPQFTCKSDVLNLFVVMPAFRCWATDGTLPLNDPDVLALEINVEQVYEVVDPELLLLTNNNVDSHMKLRPA